MWKSYTNRIPSLPCGGLTDQDGYLYSTEEQKLASYFIAMDSIGKINENGCDLSYESYFDSFFFMPFKLSHELNSYAPDVSERVLQAPTVKNSRIKLFLEFSEPLKYVIRFVCFSQWSR